MNRNAWGPPRPPCPFHRLSGKQNLYPKGFYPLPHPNHSEGGFVFPHFLIDAIKNQDGRDLTRFDIDFDLPDHFLAEFPPAIYLTPRPDLGYVSQGKLQCLRLTRVRPHLPCPFRGLLGNMT